MYNQSSSQKAPLVSGKKGNALGHQEKQTCKVLARRSTSAAYMKYNQNPMLMRLSTTTSQCCIVR